MAASKATGFKSLRLKYWEINQVTPKCQIDFWTKLAKKIQIEKVNIKFCIFKLVYSWGGRRGGGGWKIENLISGVGWRRNFIWYAKIEYKEAEVIWIANDRQNASSLSVRSSNTFNKNINKHSITSAKWSQ